MRASLPSMHVIVEKGTGSNDYLFKEWEWNGSLRILTRNDRGTDWAVGV